MVLINEWLPNPVGDDAKSEFIELYNSGTTTISVNGWMLKNESGKTVRISGVIEARGYLLLTRGETKLPLKNSDGALYLYNAASVLQDQSSFEGVAPVGKSFSRANERTDLSDHFVFSEPTPGSQNRVIESQAVENSYLPGKILNQASLGVWSTMAIALSLGVALAAVLLYALKQDEDLSELFFRRNENIW